MRIKTSYIILIFISVIVLFALVISISRKEAAEYKSVTYEQEIDSVMIYGNEGFGSARGGIFYMRNHFVSTQSRYLNDNCNYKDWISNGPFVDFDSIPHSYSLHDLGLPYKIYKPRNSDTLYISKDGCQFTFLIKYR